MPLEESFAFDAPVEAPPTPEAIAPTPITPEPAPEVPQAAEPIAAPSLAAEAPPQAAEPPAPAAEAPAAPVFDEKAWLKQFGDDVETPAQLKERLDSYKAKQLTPEIEAQIAITRDPAKLAEYANIVGKDYDKPTAAEVMREKFALDNPGMSKGLLDREFGKQFGKDFPLINQALANPNPGDEDYLDPEDPALKAELEAAEYYALAAREALKKNQTEKTQQFLAAVPAAQQPQLTDAQKADVPALAAWLDEAIKDGGALPIDLGDGTKLSLPIEKAADFKAAFHDTYRLLDSHALNPDGTINRGNQALITEFLRLGPVGFAQSIAKQARLAQPEPVPAIPVDEMTNASGKRQPVAPAPVEHRQVYNEGTPHQNYNY
ncbi:MAG: hypothetical protein ACRYFX_18855 [Janthinobacterium lividum]